MEGPPARWNDWGLCGRVFGIDRSFSRGFSFGLGFGSSGLFLELLLFLFACSLLPLSLLVGQRLDPRLEMRRVVVKRLSLRLELRRLFG